MKKYVIIMASMLILASCEEWVEVIPDPPTPIKTFDTNKITTLEVRYSDPTPPTPNKLKYDPAPEPETHNLFAIMDPLTGNDLSKVKELIDNELTFNWDQEADEFVGEKQSEKNSSILRISPNEAFNESENDVENLIGKRVFHLLFTQGGTYKNYWKETNALWDINPPDTFDGALTLISIAEGADPTYPQEDDEKAFEKTIMYKYVIKDEDVLVNMSYNEEQHIGALYEKSKDFTLSGYVPGSDSDLVEVTYKGSIVLNEDETKLILTLIEQTN